MSATTMKQLRKAAGFQANDMVGKILARVNGGNIYYVINTMRDNAYTVVPVRLGETSPIGEDTVWDDRVEIDHVVNDRLAFSKNHPKEWQALVSAYPQFAVPNSG